MSETQWFRLTGELEKEASNWYQENWISYTQKTYEVLQFLKQTDPTIETFYHQALATGNDLINGVAFVDNKPTKGWIKHEKFFNCFVPDMRTTKGKNNNDLLKSIERSPVFLEPIRKALNLPMYWSKPGSNRVVLPSFFYADDKGFFVSIDVNHALEYMSKYPELETVLAVDMQKLKLKTLQVKS